MGRYNNVITIQESGAKIGNALTRIYNSPMRGKNYDITLKNLGGVMKAVIKIETMSHSEFVDTLDYINGVFHGEGGDYADIKSISNEKVCKKRRKGY